MNTTTLYETLARDNKTKEKKMMMKPNYEDLGLSITMGKDLRELVESQLIKDLLHYHSISEDLFFDWSESCIEGKCISYLDGSLDRYSGIMVFNNRNELVADGWMEFEYLKEQNHLIVYWNYLDIYNDGIQIEVITNAEIPEHIKRHIEELKDVEF
ncbi:hypothetical protein [Cohnella terricola]|uniref:Uncharacterized protein n=1 Tax=Cohnella terricola TaxID=1289167 RepID=A0A559J4H4_9BACL|nr:hypothetical protein [Cohnella terricola]TVX94789.1 hypothetical protein FPZ45_24665 [Cohnella terricola]